PEMRPHTRAEAVAVVDTVEGWQARYLHALGRRLVYASDEYYLLADRPFPDLAAYDDCAQHENGIGMARTFEAEARAALAGAAADAPTGPGSGFFAGVAGAPADGYRAPKLSHHMSRFSSHSEENRDIRCRTFLITGEFGARVLEPLLAELPGNPQ